MRDRVSPDRIGHALQAMASDLAAARREVILLRRENRELKSRLAAAVGDGETVGRIREGRSRPTGAAATGSGS